MKYFVPHFYKTKPTQRLEQDHEHVFFFCDLTTTQRMSIRFRIGSCTKSERATFSFVCIGLALTCTLPETQL